MGAQLVNGGTILRVGLVIVATVVIQIALLTSLRVLGAHPEVIWLIPMAAGMVAGAEVGAIVGFSSGIVLDCLQPTPFGLTAMVAVMVGFAFGMLSERGVLSDVGDVWWVTPLIGAGTCAIAVIGYGLLGALVGESQFLHVDYAVIVPVVAIFGALLAIPMAMAVTWSLGDERPRRRARHRRASW